MIPDFEIEDNMLVKYHGRGGNVILPEGIESIIDRAFEDCHNLTEIQIPETVAAIGNYAFAYCDGLTHITIPEGVRRIYPNAFTECKNLKEVILPESLCEINWGVFRDCISLNSIKIPERVTVIEDYLFAGCQNLQSVILPENVQEIMDYAFYSCVKLKVQYRHYTFTPIIIPDYSQLNIMNDILRMVKYKDFSFDEIRPLSLEEDLELIADEIHIRFLTPVKARVLFEMYLSAPDEKDTLTYIQEHFTELFKLLLDIPDVDTAEQVIRSGQFLTEQNIDELIQHAIEQKAYRIQLMLTDYKYQHFGNFGKEWKL